MPKKYLESCQFCNNEPVTAMIIVGWREPMLILHIGINCLTKGEWQRQSLEQHRQSLEQHQQHCIVCGKDFKCYGECKDKDRIHTTDKNCWCGKCGESFLKEPHYKYLCESRFGDKAKIFIKDI